MPKSSEPVVTQRRSQRPSHLRTSSSDSDPLHHRAKTDRSPKLGGSRRSSPRGTLSDPPVTQKKLGTRIADLESQLGQAQEELKSLKDQLVSAEEAKKAAQEQLDGKAKKPPTVSSVPAEEIQVKKCSQRPIKQEIEREESRCAGCEISEENQQETDVFEVPMEKLAIEDAVELSEPIKEEQLKMEADNVSTESPSILEQEKQPVVDDLANKDDEINALKAKLEEKEKELRAVCQENERLKSQVEDKSSEISAVQSKEEEIMLKLNNVIKELEESKSNVFEVKKKLEASESMKEALENEMKKLRVQTEQWRKAADAAAAVLSGDVEMSGRKVSERCSSMDKHAGSVYDVPVGGYGNGYFGSPGMIGDRDDDFGSGKRKGSGIRMLGDLLKKKGHK